MIISTWVCNERFPAPVPTASTFGVDRSAVLRRTDLAQYQGSLYSSKHDGDNKDETNDRTDDVASNNNTVKSAAGECFRITITYVTCDVEWILKTK